MKWLLILAILFGAVQAAPSAQESLGTKIKKALDPDPTPSSRKHRKHSAKKATATPSPTPSAKRKKASPTPSPTATAKSKSKRKHGSPTPTPEPQETPTETPVPSTSERGQAKKAWPNVSLSPNEIEGYESDSTKVREILDAGLALAKENLGYAYGSADPTSGGMDCSGFIYYVLKQNGFADVPRDSSQQYVWVRKGGGFYAHPDILLA